jgi:hypothetical protein
MSKPITLVTARVEVRASGQRVQHVTIRDVRALRNAEAGPPRRTTPHVVRA